MMCWQFHKNLENKFNFKVRNAQTSWHYRTWFARERILVRLHGSGATPSNYVPFSRNYSESSYNYTYSILQEIDMCVSIAITWESADKRNYFDFTYPIMWDDIAMITPAPRNSSKAIYFFTIFSWEVYRAIGS